MAKKNPIINYVSSLFRTGFDKGIVIFLRNFDGTLVGGVLGYFLFKRYEAGLLLQREMSRAFMFMGMQGDQLARMILFILVSAYLGALLMNMIRGNK